MLGLWMVQSCSVGELFCFWMVGTFWTASCIPLYWFCFQMVGSSALFRPFQNWTILPIFKTFGFPMGSEFVCSVFESPYCICPNCSSFLENLSSKIVFLTILSILITCRHDTCYSPVTCKYQVNYKLVLTCK